MAANDDVADSDSSDCVFDAGGYASPLRTICWHDISGIPSNKQLSWFTLRYELGYHGAIGTRDKESLWFLIMGKLPERFRSFRKRNRAGTSRSLQ